MLPPKYLSPQPTPHTPSQNRLPFEGNPRGSPTNPFQTTLGTNRAPFASPATGTNTTPLAGAKETAGGQFANWDRRNPYPKTAEGKAAYEAAMQAWWERNGFNGRPTTENLIPLMPGTNRQARGTATHVDVTTMEIYASLTAPKTAPLRQRYRHKRGSGMPLAAARTERQGLRINKVMHPSSRWRTTTRTRSRLCQQAQTRETWGSRLHRGQTAGSQDKCLSKQHAPGRTRRHGGKQWQGRGA